MTRDGARHAWIRRLAVLLMASAAVSARAEEPSAARALRDLEAGRAALARHVQSTGALPRTPAELGTAVLTYAPEVPLAGARPVDPWGHPWVYAATPDATPPFRLYSVGANGRDENGAGDDLTTRDAADVHTYPELLERQRRALGLFPVLMIFALAPVIWGLLRLLRRGTG